MCYFSSERLHFLLSDTHEVSLRIMKNFFQRIIGASVMLMMCRQQGNIFLWDFKKKKELCITFH